MSSKMSIVFLKLMGKTRPMSSMATSDEATGSITGCSVKDDAHNQLFKLRGFITRSRTNSKSSRENVPSSVFDTASSTLVGSDNHIPDWMSVMDIVDTDLSGPNPFWNILGGYIERNGHYVGITESHHAEMMANAQSEHEDEVEDLTTHLEEALMKMRVANRARDAGKKKVGRMQNTINRLECAASEKDQLLNEAQEQARRVEANHNKVLEAYTKELREIKQRFNAVHTENNDLNHEFLCAKEGVRNLAKILNETEATCENLVQHRIQDNNKIQELKHRLNVVQQEVNRLPMRDMYCTALEQRNESLSGQVQSLSKENFVLDKKAIGLAQKVAMLEARVADLENLPAEGQSDETDMKAMRKENARLVEQCHGYRVKNHQLKTKVHQKDVRITELEAANDDLFDKNSDLLDEQVDIEKLRPVAERAMQLEVQATNLRLELNTRWLQLANDPQSGAFGEVIRKQCGQIQVLEVDNSVLRATNHEMTKVQEQHKGCEKEIWGANKLYGLAQQVIASLRKQTNHTVDAYDKLRIAAGLQSQFPVPGLVGLNKVQLSAMFEAMCRTYGFQMTEELKEFCMQQDALTLEQAPEDKNPLPWNVEPTGFEKAVLSMVDNFGELFERLFDEKTRLFDRPLHPMIRAEEVKDEQDGDISEHDKPDRAENDDTPEQQDDSRPFVFANMKDLLSEVRTGNQLGSSASSEGKNKNEKEDVEEDMNDGFADDELSDEDITSKEAGLPTLTIRAWSDVEDVEMVGKPVAVRPFEAVFGVVASVIMVSGVCFGF